MESLHEGELGITEGEGQAVNSRLGYVYYPIWKRAGGKLWEQEFGVPGGISRLTVRMGRTNYELQQVVLRYVGAVNRECQGYIFKVQEV